MMRLVTSYTYHFHARCVEEIEHALRKREWAVIKGDSLNGVGVKPE
jgi:hypothetical protein